MDSYSLREQKERLAFKSTQDDVVKLIKDEYGEDCELTIFYTQIGDKTKFDITIHIYDKNAQKIAANIYEIKVRDKHYDELLFEKNKYNSLKKIEKRESDYFPKVNMYYINYTPKGTYLFNINKLGKIKWGKTYAPKSTVEKKEKVAKDTTLLCTCLATKINFVFDYHTSLAKYDNNLNKKMNNQKKIKGIFDQIDRNNNE